MIVFSDIIIRRTLRAFNTHPIEWFETKKITNKIYSLELGEDVNGYSRTINDSSKWFGRVRLCYIISESAMNAGKETKVSQKS